MRSLIIFFLSLLFCLPLQATSPFTIKVTPDWHESPYTHDFFPGQTDEILYFTDADYHPKHPSLPSYVHQFRLSSYGRISAKLSNAQFVPVEKKMHKDDQYIGENIQIKTAVNLERRQAFGSISFIPLRKNQATGQLEKLISADITIRHFPEELLSIRGSGSTVSALSQGDIYKIAVSEAGVYKIDQNFLNNELGINTSGIDPRQIKVYGNGGGLLPELLSTPRYDDLEENAIFVEGENDGSFDASDYILFYAEGPDQWTYDEGNESFDRQKNYYSDKSYYFLIIGSGNGKRVASQASIGGASYNTSSYDAILRHEDELVNLLDYYQSAHPAGKEWFGDNFKFVLDRTYDFSLSNIITTEPVNLRARFAGRNQNGGTHKFDVFYDGNIVASVGMGSVGGGATSTYAALRTLSNTFNATNDNIQLRVEYTQPTAAEGWLDWIDLHARCQLNYKGSPLIFRDIRSLEQSTANFTLSSVNNNVIVWDVTNPLNPANQDYNLNGSQLTFGTDTDVLKTFVAFENGSLPVPEFIETVANQNLHGILTPPDMIVIYPMELESQANSFVAHRTSQSGITVQAVPLSQIYNEFSSGSPDVSAIRDFCKMLYDRSTTSNSFKYLLLFGDGTFDYKNIREDENYVNYVPVYETTESMSPIFAYPSDDYFALLDDNEGAIESGLMDIAIGRFPVKSPAEADIAMDKLIRYETNPITFGDWRNRLLYIADDQDSNIHFRDADSITRSVINEFPAFNINKIYFDAYRQISTPGGNRYPDATEAINTGMFQGNLVMNYTGHGGSNGWAQERVVTQETEMPSWDNANKLPLIVTATCSFAPYDDPRHTTAGEYLFLKPDGGGIALYTTVRAVYASANYRLSKSVFDRLFTPIDNAIPPIGETLRVGKNMSGTAVENSRKFTLLGDPSMNLVAPQYDVITTKVNNQTISGADTIKALQEVTIEGVIQDANSNLLSDFNGILYPTVYDKTQTITTLGNDPDSAPATFRLQKNVLFRGRASVSNGEFKFSFVVPGDIDFEYGFGKISYYADDGIERDANGFYNGIIIGGTATGVSDNTPPEVEVYMNDEEFVLGGITDENPILVVKLSDDLGINTAGTGIGHDLTGTLDEDTQNTYILNDFYESELDNPRKGEVRYPLTNLAEGRHAIKVKAWDVSNNSAEGYTEFVVADNAEVALDHVLNYPNPFTTSTNFQFEHNFPGQELNIQVQIFTVSGKLVKTIQEQIITDGYRVSNVAWDGTDDYGDRIGRGVYVYKVSVNTAVGEQQLTTKSDFEKLVILR